MLQNLLAQGLHWLGFGLCHQLPQRSFFGGGVQVPVCARDTGIYIGFCVTVLFIALWYRGRRPAGSPPVHVIVLAALGITAMGIDGVTSYAGLRTTTNDLRLLTGLMAGYAIGVVVVPMLNGQLWRRPGTDRALAGAVPTMLWLVSLPVVFAVTRWGLPWLGIGYPLLVAAAIVATFVMVNMVMVCLVSTFENRAESWRDVIAPAAVGLALTVVELAGASALRAWLLSLAASLAR